MSNYIHGPAVLKPGKPWFAVDTTKLPPGSVTVDNNPEGHVLVKGVDPGDLKDAVSDKGKFPK